MRLRLALPFVMLSAALAQGPMGPHGGMGPGFGPMEARVGPGGLDEIKTYLGLTDAQVQNMQQVRQTANQNLRTTFDQIHTTQTSLRDLLDKGTTDAAAVGKLVLQIETLRKQVEQSQSSVRTQVVAQLTAAQATKLKTLEDAEKLEPAIHGAIALGLLAPPSGSPGVVMFGGPGMFGAMRSSRAPRVR